MCVDAHVPSGARQTLVLPVWYVLLRPRVDELLRETKVYYVDRVVFFARRPPDQEVFRLHISVDQVLWVNVFNAGDLHPQQHGVQ